MIIIAIAWLYVALMLSIGANSLIGALLSFIAWGPLPLAIFWYIFGRRSRKHAENLQEQKQSSDE